jgi:hypothetical protein
VALGEQVEADDNQLVENIEHALRQLELFVPLAQRLIVNLQALLDLIARSSRT